MRYLVVIVAALLVMGGCFPASNNMDNSATYATQEKADKRNQDGPIKDEEFDLLIAPEYDYETEIPYSEQIKNTPAKKQTKSAKKPAAVRQ